MPTKPNVHKPGVFNLPNKAHKHGRHRSKGEINSASKGKTSVKKVTRKQKINLSREQRRHQASQLRQTKRDKTLAQKRSLGGYDCSPFLVCIVSLNKDYDPLPVLSVLTECEDGSTIQRTNTGITTVVSGRLKKHFSFIIPDMDNELAMLDTMKVCDTIIFVVSAAAGISFGSELIDKYGERLLISSFAQGLAKPVIVATDLTTLNPKKMMSQKKNIENIMNNWFPEEKIFTVNKTQDGLNILRKISCQKLKTVPYRDRRPYLYAENIEYEDAGYEGTLKVSGYLRGGKNLSPNDLVYIPGLGAYQMQKIYQTRDKIDLEKSGNCKEMGVCHEPDPEKQEPLISENIPNPMDAEQTWPTEAEIDLAQQEQKKVKKVPKGWSEYQAAWIPDDDAEIEDGSSEESEGEEDSNYMDAMSEDRSVYSDAEEEYDTLTVSELPMNDQQYDEQLDVNRETSELEKLKAAKMNVMFPDEIDTPIDLPARVRFQKYRAMKCQNEDMSAGGSVSERNSFGMAKWDPKENLPIDYARIFQFENFNRTKKRIFKELEDMEGGAVPGMWTTIYIKDIPRALWTVFESTKSVLTLFGMYPHENKMSVVNIVLRRTGLSDEPIQSKERLIFQCGVRRFIANPIFSEHTNGNKHKFERFFQADSTIVATIFAPIQYPPAPVLCYKEVNDQLLLVATGSVLSCDPDRIIIKRVVLSGHPLKVNKKSLVVRFMFFNREDINYFKPCPLRTRSGIEGKILEPLGTHGHMKCKFKRQVKSQDVVFMRLYKRVFPKWTYEECIARRVDAYSKDCDANMEI